MEEIKKYFTVIEHGSKYKFRAWPAFDKSMALKLIEIMREREYGSISETIREILKEGIERRDVECEYCVRKIERRSCIKREGKYFCNMECYMNFVAERKIPVVMENGDTNRIQTV